MHRWVLLVAAGIPLAAAAQWTFDAEGTRVYDDNLSNAQRDSDIIRDRAWTGRAAFGRSFAVEEWDASVRAEARGARHDRYSGLDHVGLGMRAGARRKLGIGLTAPWIAADAAVSEERFDERIRDGLRSSLSLALGKRFHQRLEGSVRAAYDRRSQRHDRPTTDLSGRPFSLQGRSISLHGSYALTEQALLFANTGWRRGDVVSSTRRNSQIFRQSAAIANDPAFGPDFIAYRLSGARTWSGSAGLSWALGRRASVDAALTRHQTRARGGLDYDGNVYRIALVYSN